MATNGFEFAFNLDGSNHTPAIRDWPMDASTPPYRKGDLLSINGAGNGTKAAAGIGEVLGVCQETTQGNVAAGTEVKVAIITREQIWRCSMDAATTALIPGVTKNMNIVDENTIDADNAGAGSLQLYKTGEGNDGNLVAYVNFLDTTFGNA